MESDRQGKDMFDRLPIEIIAEILSYLKATERKQARLVCTRFNEASKEIAVLKRQQFMFKKIFHENQLNQLFKIVENGHFKYSNFEFESANFDENFDKFIESQGATIRSFHFKCCTFAFKTLEKIMIDCINLEELRLFDVSCTFDDAVLQVPVVNGTKIRRDKLKVLRVHLCEWMSDSLLTFFIDVYPNIKELALVSKPNESRLTYRHFRKTITDKCKRIETLSLQSPFSDGMSDDDFAELAYSACIRLKGLTLIPSKQIISSRGYQRFFSIQKGITILDIFECGNFDFECFRLLLRQIPDLRTLRIKFIDDVPVKELFELLAKSRLKAMQCKIRADLNDVQNIDSSLVNGRLQTLVLYLKESKNIRLLPILKIFPNVSALNISILRENLHDACKTASYIFESLVNLKTLVLRQNWIEDMSSEKCKRLTKLRHLQLYECQNLSDSVTSRFNFPELKYLCLDKCNQIKRRDLIHLSETSPLLEYFEINSIGIVEDEDKDNEMLLQICRNLKFLCQLKFHYRITRSDVKQMKDACPSLRVVRTKSFIAIFRIDFQINVCTPVIFLIK